MQKLEDLLPKEFTACPNCGSTQRLAEQAAKEAGLPHPKGAAIEIIKIPIPKPLQPMDLIVSLDICVGCGTIYAKEMSAEAVRLVVSPPQRQRGDGGPPTGV